MPLVLSPRRGRPGSEFQLNSQDLLVPGTPAGATEACYINRALEPERPASALDLRGKVDTGACMDSRRPPQGPSRTELQQLASEGPHRQQRRMAHLCTQERLL